MQVFNDMAKQMRFPPKKGFALDVATRWNSTFYMLLDALSYKDVLNRYASEYYNNCPSSEEWKKIETISKFLESFHDATKVFSGTKYPTANLYFKEVWEIRTVLSDGKLATDETIKQLTIEMQKKFNKYWSECNKMLLIASILDPRMKLIFLECCFKEVYDEEESSLKIGEIYETLATFYTIYANGRNSQFSKISAENISTKDDGTSCDAIDSRKRKLVDIKFSEYKRQLVVRPKSSELDKYLEEYVMDIKDMHFDILDWWKNNTLNYPVLSRMARDILAIPVTTVSSESAFSTSGRIIDQFRSSMNSKTVEALVCSKDWISVEYQNGKNFYNFVI